MSCLLFRKPYIFAIQCCALQRSSGHWNINLQFSIRNGNKLNKAAGISSSFNVTYLFFIFRAIACSRVLYPISNVVFTQHLIHKPNQNVYMFRKIYALQSGRGRYQRTSITSKHQCLTLSYCVQRHYSAHHTNEVKNDTMRQTSASLHCLSLALPLAASLIHIRTSQVNLIRLIIRTQSLFIAIYCTICECV